MSDYEEKLESELTASFLGMLVRAVRRCDYGIDRRKLYDFVRWCFENEGKDYPGDEVMEKNSKELQYYIERNGTLWSGPHSSQDTLHWAPEGKNGLFDVARRSGIAADWISITPHQVVRILARKN